MSDEIGRVNAWLGMLKSGIREERLDALTAVGREAAGWICRRRRKLEEEVPGDQALFDAEVRDAVLASLRDRDPEVKAEAALAVAAWDDPECAEVLLALVDKGEDDRVRQAAIQSLSAMRSPKTRKKLYDITQDKSDSPVVRAQALATVPATTPGGDTREGASITFGEADSRITPRGAVRTRGSATAKVVPLEEGLLAIEQSDDEPPYVRFLAGRARRKLSKVEGM